MKAKFKEKYTKTTLSSASKPESPKP